VAKVGEKLTQLVSGLMQIPVFVRESALVISDNGDLYGTVAEVKTRGMGVRRHRPTFEDRV
jgi:hypothetical protein